MSLLPSTNVIHWVDHLIYSTLLFFFFTFSAQNHSWVTELSKLRFSTYLQLFIIVSSLHLFHSLKTQGLVTTWPQNLTIQCFLVFFSLASIINLSRFSLSSIVAIFASLYFFYTNSSRIFILATLALPIIFWFGLKLFNSFRYVVSNLFVISTLIYLLIYFILNSMFFADLELFLFEHMDFYRERRPEWKRVTLIIEGLKVAKEHFILGIGFGPKNYLENVSSILRNVPQLFPLTMISYGGVGMLILTSAIFDWSTRRHLAIIRAKNLQIWFLTGVICFWIFLQLHEYIFNPHVIFSYSIFLTSVYLANLECGKSVSARSKTGTLNVRKGPKDASIPL